MAHQRRIHPPSVIKRIAECYYLKPPMPPRVSRGGRGVAFVMLSTGSLESGKRLVTDLPKCR